MNIKFQRVALLFAIDVNEKVERVGHCSLPKQEIAAINAGKTWHAELPFLQPVMNTVAEGIWPSHCLVKVIPKRKHESAFQDPLFSLMVY